MQTISELALKRSERGYFTRDQAAVWVDDRGARLDGLLKRAVKSQEVTRVARGLYVLDRELSGKAIDPLALAQLLYGPSYLSLELALSFHGWIPEAVYTITSVSTKRSRVFDTPIGYFTFTRVPQRLFFAEVERLETANGSAYFLATPLKALADLVYVRRSEESPRDLLASLRIDREDVLGLEPDRFETLASVYPSRRVQRFLEALRREITP